MRIIKNNKTYGGKVTLVNGNIDASNIPFSHERLSATNILDAINELYTKLKAKIDKESVQLIDDFTYSEDNNTIVAGPNATTCTVRYLFWYMVKGDTFKLSINGEEKISYTATSDDPEYFVNTKEDHDFPIHPNDVITIEFVSNINYNENNIFTVAVH